MKALDTIIELNKIKKGENRKVAKEQGYYYGRYQTKIVPDKKKEKNKGS